MNQPIIHQPPQKKYDGEYIGTVETVDDPENLMRVKVRVLPLFPDEIKVSDLPWAEYKLPIGARAGEGIFNPVKVGDYVWVDFPHNGDTRRPRITGAVHYCPDKVSNLPHDAWAGPDAFEHARTGDEPAPTNPEYHDGSIVIDENGALIEIRADKSICVTQKDTKTAVEITPDGKITIHGESDINASSTGNVNVLVTGTASLTAPTINMTGDVNITGDVGVSGDVNASGSVIDGAGNTNHHSH